MTTYLSVSFIIKFETKLIYNNTQYKCGTSVTKFYIVIKANTHLIEANHF